MRTNESPSLGSLHSVGALMDPSYLRTAVADANGVARERGAPPRSGWSRTLARVQVALARLDKAVR